MGIRTEDVSGQPVQNIKHYLKGKNNISPDYRKQTQYETKTRNTTQRVENISPERERKQTQSET